MQSELYLADLRKRLRRKIVMIRDERRNLLDEQRKLKVELNNLIDEAKRRREKQ